MDINAYWSPYEKKINSFDDLVGVINKLTKKSIEKNIQFAWRGQVNASWALHSSLYRRCFLTKNATLDESELTNTEGDILADLHRWGLHSPNSNGRLSALKQLAMLQHYGAPTRLIDVSFNAWVGIWFAVERRWDNGALEHENADARLFAIDVTNRLINENSEMRSWEDDLYRPWRKNAIAALDERTWTTSVFAWKPPKLDDRISAQNGGFLFGGVPGSTNAENRPVQYPKSRGQWWHIDEVRTACSLPLRTHKYEATRGAVRSGALYTFRIKASAKEEIRHSLEKMFGYTHATIYPDYTGFANFGTPFLKSRP